MHDETLRNTLSERFEGYTSQPTDAVWESIEKVLDEDEKAAGFRFNLLSPLVLTLLIGSSAAALALVIFLSGSEESNSTPFAEGDSPAYGLSATHSNLQASSEFSNARLISLALPSENGARNGHNRHVPHFTSRNFTAFEFQLPPYPLLTDAPKTIEQFQGIYLDENNCTQTTRYFNDQLDEGLYTMVESKSSLTVELLLSSFVNVGTNANNGETPNNFGEEPTPEGNKTVQKNNRFAEAELNFQGYFTKRLKGGAGVSVAYSNEQGSVSDNSTYATTQWSIGIPITIGFDVVRHKRFGVSVLAKLLNDFDQRTTSSTTIIPDPNTATAPLIVSSSTTKDQVYRFGLQPMVSCSYYVSPRTALSLGVSYRYYFKDSRESNVSFQRSPYLGVSLGVGYIL